MKQRSLMVFLLLFTTVVTAQDIAGTWQGTLSLPAVKLRLVFHITKTDSGYTSTMDSPDQGAAGIPMDVTSYKKDSLTLSLNRLALRYQGTYRSDSDIVQGTFTQSVVSVPLTLRRGNSSTAPVVRPQEPKSFSYRTEEVEFINPRGGNRLVGTLTMPAGGKASSVVVMITGSGPQDRNEELRPFNHRPFLVWSDWLTRQGIAVLRYDDRGVGKSNGSFQGATSADFADDAEAAVSYILSRPDLKALSIGLMGHSEGGMIAPVVATRNKAVKFVVLLAAPGIPVARLMEDQTEDQMRLSGAGSEMIAAGVEESHAIYSALVKYKDLPDSLLKRRMDSLLIQRLKEKPASDVSGRLLDPWFRYFITFDPQFYLSKLTCPVLALNGTKDSQVRSTPNLEGIRASLQKAGNKHFEVVALPGLNHLFQRCSTGSLSEYGEIEETVNPQALEKVAAWINRLPLK